MIEASFQWTAEQAAISTRYHLRNTCRRPFRVASYVIAVLAIAGGIFRITRFGWSFLAFSLIAGGVYWIFLRRYDVEWTARRRFKKRPDKDKFVKWQLSPEEITFETEGIGGGTVKWNAFTKAVKTPKGYLLYPNDQMYYWLPIVALNGHEKDFEELLRKNLSNVVDLA